MSPDGPKDAPRWKDRVEYFAPHLCVYLLHFISILPTYANLINDLKNIIHFQVFFLQKFAASCESA